MPRAEAAEVGPERARQRRSQARDVRVDAARLARERDHAVNRANGEEALYPDGIANFHKGLPHDDLGEVDPAAYQALRRAVSTGRARDFEAIPLGLGRKLVNPMAGLAFDLEGPDGSSLFIRPAPTIAGAEGGAEMVELYWMALARDVHFMDYASDPTMAAAAQDLSSLTGFRGPRAGGLVPPGTIFRGDTMGDLVGPYLSQFLWLDISMGAMPIDQRMKTPPAGSDHLLEYDDWLAVQNGLPAVPYALDPTLRYIRNLRDLAEWVHVDALYQAYHQACLILLGLGAPVDPGNPYASSRTQDGFGTFGNPHILSLVTEVATRALKAVWYQKWYVHRRLRPEALGGLVHHTLTGRKAYPLHAELLNSDAVDAVAARFGSFLLPLGCPEGSPLHPSYGSGHATVAGACVTVLKAWFDESFVVPEPVVPDASGTGLLPWTGPPLTVGGELNKLAANIAQGRSALGIHYRSDFREALRLGEAVALGILEEQKLTYAESSRFTITRFDGTTVVI